MDADEYDSEYDDGDDATDECPYCGRAIYDDAVQCPHCGNYVSKEDAPRERLPIWVMLGFVLAFLAVLLWLWPM